MISNDKKLVEDANNLNKQASCYGNLIYVSYITLNGYLETCSCVYEKNEVIVVEKVVEKDIVKYITVKEKNKDQLKDTSFFNHILIGSLSFVVGLLAAKSITTMKL